MKHSMKAMVLSRFGGADAFEMRDVPVPDVGPRQVRVRIHATAVNPLDYQIRRGDYKDYVPLPAITGFVADQASSTILPSGSWRDEHIKISDAASNDPITRRQPRKVTRSVMQSSAAKARKAASSGPAPAKYTCPRGSSASARSSTSKPLFA